MKGKPIDLIGQRFDKLLVIGIAERTRSGTIWACRCDCGAECSVLTSRLRRVVSIGCKSCESHSRAAAHIRHGEALGRRKTKLYMVWKGMRSRCRDIGNTSYRYYGGKGIAVCPEWSEFAAFRTWALANGYRDGLSIDRLDGSLGYSPSNCEIVTRSENSRRAHTARHLAV